MKNHDLKRGDEVVVVEEEDTTREVRRLESTLSMAMKQIKVSIASSMLVFDVGDWSPPFVGHSTNYQTTAPSNQEDGAPRRGEREAEGSYEANGEKRPEGQRERDLAKSNARDLRYQKGDISEQLTTISE